MYDLYEYIQSTTHNTYSRQYPSGASKTIVSHFATIQIQIQEQTLFNNFHYITVHTYSVCSEYILSNNKDILWTDITIGHF